MLLTEAVPDSKLIGISLENKKAVLDFVLVALGLRVIQSSFSSGASLPSIKQKNPGESANIALCKGRQAYVG